MGLTGVRMATEINTRRIIEQMGGEQQVNMGLREFKRRVREFDAKRSQFISLYPDKWVAMGEKEAVVVADALEALLEEMERCGMPRDGAVIDFIDTKNRTMVL